MGDRTWAKIYYPLWAEPVVLKLAEEEGGDGDGTGRDMNVSANGGWPLGFMEENECNFGEHPLEDSLKEKMIPYDIEWGRGDNYGPGSKSVRYTKKGKVVVREIYDEWYEDIGREAVNLARSGDAKGAQKVIEKAASDPYYKVVPLAKCEPVTEEHKKIAKLVRTQLLTEKEAA